MFLKTVGLFKKYCRKYSVVMQNTRFHTNLIPIFVRIVILCLYDTLKPHVIPFRLFSLHGLLSLECQDVFLSLSPLKTLC